MKKLKYRIYNIDLKRDIRIRSHSRKMKLDYQNNRKLNKNINIELKKEMNENKFS